MHPAIRTASAARLGATAAGAASSAGAASPADEAPAPPGTAARAKALVRRAGGAVLDRVGDRAAAATAGQVDQLREELDRTRRELQAEIELLRAELAGREAGTD